MSVLSEVATLRKSVVYVFSRRVSSEGTASLNPLGTGFLVAVPHHKIGGAVWPYFVTAKHVVKLDSGSYRGEIFVRANLKNWSPSNNQPGVAFLRLPILDTKGKLQGAIHSNPAVDIVVCQQFPSFDEFDVIPIPIKAFLTQNQLQKAKIVEGHELFFPCFTPEIPQRNRNNPVIRFGRIALISNEFFVTPEGKINVLFAECFPFGGNSGSPVFIKVRIESGEEKYALIGIMKGHFNVTQPIRIQQTQPHLLARQHMGIAAIVPVDYLREILYSDDLRRQRGEIN